MQSTSGSHPEDEHIVEDVVYIPAIGGIGEVGFTGYSVDCSSI